MFDNSNSDVPSTNNPSNDDNTTFPGSLPLPSDMYPSKDSSLVPQIPNDNTSPVDNSNLNADSSPADEALLSLKKSALEELTPLVGKLDQSPIEKFKTTMMMIQASDDKSLLKSAYESAKKIEDEKLRAQALLDVVNEINYFTHHETN